MKILPVILSGGSGTRLWPLSRSGYPKQLQALEGTRSLLQQTALRLWGLPDILPPLLVCGEAQRFLVAEQLREVGVTPSSLVLEPLARSTAPAIAAAALCASDPDQTVLVVMPADHFIADTQAFRKAIRQAAVLALQGRLMTLGVRPSTPHTGFGYIEQGEPLPEDGEAFAVMRFKEKPDEPTARAYLESGRYLWNSGIFVFRADRYLAELERFEPDILLAAQAALKAGARDLDFLRLEAEAYARSPNISVDYAVMERAEEIGVLPVSFGWSDIGGWQALWQIGTKDENGNVLKGDVIASDTKNTYVQGAGRLVSVIGLEDIVVVDTKDALLVADKKRADEVKDIVARLKQEGRSESEEHLRVWRPWGSYEQIASGPRFQVKQLVVKPGGRLSLQKHHHRAEHWVVVSGTAKIQCGEETRLMGPNEAAYIPLGTLHRLENPGLVPLLLIEVQSGDYFGEDDIVRFDDVYRRV